MVCCGNAKDLNEKKKNKNMRMSQTEKINAGKKNKNKI